MLINFVVPATNSNRNLILLKKIWIQQDNTRPHIEPTDWKFFQATFGLNLNVELVFPLPNTPDLNVLDIGCFNSIQSLQYHSDPKKIQELVEVVGTSFDVLLWTKQKVMEAIILCNGNNNFKVPHVCKRKIERIGQFPVAIKVLDSV